MSDPAAIPELGCTECVKLRHDIEKLKTQVRDLTARLKQNSSNSSKPPSSDPPWIPPFNPKKPSGKSPGAQPGHTGFFRTRLPAERLSHIVNYIPQTCVHCQSNLTEQCDPHLLETSWHQVAELPSVLAEITEHRAHQRTCACCGKMTSAKIPDEIREHCTGPKLAATLSYMSGCLHSSKRAIQDTCETLFGVPLSLGTISKLEAGTSAALEVPHAEALKAVREAPVKNVDETGWAKQGKLCWLWLAATASIAVFSIHAILRAGQMSGFQKCK